LIIVFETVLIMTD